MRRAQEDINRLFGGLRLTPRVEFPPVNVWANAEGAVVTAEIPGVSPEQIDVAIDQETVMLRGERNMEPLGDDVVIHRQERVQGAFARSFVLPFRVDTDAVSARFERGVLKLDLPRPASDKPRKINVARA
jgi:HSP20 family protein